VEYIRRAVARRRRIVWRAVFEIEHPELVDALRPRYDESKGWRVLAE
jgi:hypothetical protein